MDGSTPQQDKDTPLAALTRDELESQITELAGQLNAANYRWLLLIAEFDRRNGWADGRLRSCAHWLNFKVGLNLGAAREKVRVAHALPGVPKIAAAMARDHELIRRRLLGTLGSVVPRRRLAHRAKELHAMPDPKLRSSLQK